MLAKDVPKVGQSMDSNISKEELEEKGANMIFDQLKASLATVDAFLTILEILEILIDALTFTDQIEGDRYFDAGIMAGKGLVNSGFTTYYIVMKYWKPNEDYNFDYERTDF